MIHPTAIIHPQAKVDSSVEVGPYALIDEAVVVGRDCVVGPHVHLTGDTTIGIGNRFHTGCVIGDAPQDLKYGGAPTRLQIGDHNVFREHFTIHRSNSLEEVTTVGSHCFLMAHAHIGHNCHVGDYVIMANGALLGGHVTVEERAFISGNCLVHQFVRVGTLALMQGGAAISKDLPPFTVARGDNGMCGLNSIGLRRAGFTPEQRVELKRLYQFLFRRPTGTAQAIAAAQATSHSPPAKVMIEFARNATRGICSDTGRFMRISGKSR